MRLAALLEDLPEATLERLLETRGASLDRKKILSAAEQAARALATVPPRLLAALTPSAREALDRLVPAPGALSRVELGAGAQKLVELGLAFERGDEVVCPSALRVQLPSTRREDPRAARALLGAASEETLRALLSGGMRSRAGGPRSLWLGELLDQLEDPRALGSEIATLPLAERLALGAIEARGGEVSGSDLLALAREPARWETPGTIPKKGPAHALLARGYLFPSGHDRFVLASEVAAIAGKERRELLERRRRALLSEIQAAEDEPQRAELARDAGPLALALLVELVAGSELPPGGRALRRSELAKAARALDVAPERAELLVTLIRALPLQGVAIGELGGRLVAAWRRSALGDESAPAGARSADRAPSAIVLVRELALDVLAGLPRGTFVRVEDVIAAARADQRTEGIEAGMRARGGVALDEVLRRIALVSLPALGLVDVARDGSLRFASRASALLSDASTSAAREASNEPVTWIDRRARFDASAPLSMVLSLARIARAAIDDGLVLALDPSRPRPLSVDPAVITRALDRARCPSRVAEAVIASLPSAVAVAHASPPARWIPIDDPALRARLLEDPEVARDVIEGAPPNGLLLHAHGSFPRLVRLFAKHGIDLRDRP